MSAVKYFAFGIGLCICIYLVYRLICTKSIKIKEVPGANFENCERVAKLSMADVIKYFKDDRILKILRDNKNYIAVVLKSHNPNSQYYNFIYAIFDTKKSTIIEHYEIVTSDIDEVLKKSFANKEMLVLK